MVAVKLTFLKIKGRAELIRFLLAQASIQFEDIRLEIEEWSEKMSGWYDLSSYRCAIL